MKRRQFLTTSLVTGSIIFISPTLFGQKKKKIPLIIDADTANEIDDLYAIVRAIYEPGLDLKGLSSGQWEHQLSPKFTAKESQRLNEDILRLTRRQDIPSPLGSDMKIGKPWGGSEPRETAAANHIIKTANSVLAGEKLSIISLGAPTNLASAIQLNPEIIPKIKCYCLGGKYFSDRDVWDKDEFNFRRDLNAINVLFNTDNLDLFIMPANILYEYKYAQDEVFKRLKGKGDTWDYLVARWISHAPDSKQRIMWDLAMVQALIHPEFAEYGTFKSPPENKQREIHVYTSIRREAMFQDWWDMVDRVMKGN
ncbi:nucleoside hydrolase [Bacteroidota bacterium]